MTHILAACLKPQQTAGLWLDIRFDGDAHKYFYEVLPKGHSLQVAEMSIVDWRSRGL